MKTALFDFILPDDRIATHPVTPRDAARLLVIRCDGLEDKRVVDLPDLLRAGDVMVFNNTRVIPARLHGKRGNVTVEMTLHKYLGGKRWLAFARPGKRLKVSDNIIISNVFSCTLHAKYETGEIEIEWNEKNWQELLYIHGHMPLPHYMKRVSEHLDNEQYQTVYAQRDGAVAAPTAGLHFTKSLLEDIERKGIKIAYVTLHVGGGTFLPVKAEDTDQHAMHSEYIELSEETAGLLNDTRGNGGRIVAVGTTSLRVLESASSADGTLRAYSGETNIFITPGYRFKAVEILMTNFHLPRSTLFMLTSAFMGLERMQEAYRHAIDRKYRFYSYGDACLLYRS
jgi:S-adenosylmethionine:tRNA ribosyltransferase-isomerase